MAVRTNELLLIKGKGDVKSPISIKEVNNELNISGANVRVTTNFTIEGDFVIDGDITTGDQLTLSNTTAGQGQLIINAGADAENALTIRDLTTDRLVLDIDATTTDFLDIVPVITTANILDINCSTVTTGNVFDLSDADGLTTGKILNLVSNSASTGTRSLVQITNDNALATAATCLTLSQDSTGENSPIITATQGGTTVFKVQNNGGVLITQRANSVTAPNNLNVLEATQADHTNITSDPGGGLRFVGGTITITGGFGLLRTGINVLAGTITAASTIAITECPAMNVQIPAMSGSADIQSLQGIRLVAGATNNINNVTGASKYRGIAMGGITFTLTQTTQLTSNAAFASISMNRHTINQSGGAVTVDSCALLYIQGASTAGASVTITNNYALWVDADDTRLDGSLLLGTNATATANILDIVSTATTTGNIIDIGDADSLTTGKILNLVSNSASTGTRTLVQITNDNTLATGTTPLTINQDAATANILTLNKSGTPVFEILNHGGINLTQAAVSGGAIVWQLIPGAHTAVTSENNVFNIQGNTQTITGDFTLYRHSNFGPPTITSVGAQEINTMSTVNVNGLPRVAGSARARNAIGLQFTMGTISGTNNFSNTSGDSKIRAFNIAGWTATLTQTTQMTSTASVANAAIRLLTLDQTGGAVTVDSAAGLYIEGAVVAGASVTITTNYALWVDSGISAFGGAVQPDSNDVGALGASGTAWSDLFLASGAVINFATADVTITHATDALTFAGGNYTFTQPVFTTGSPTGFTFNGGAHTTLTAGDLTEVNCNLNRTIQFTTGVAFDYTGFSVTAPTLGATAATQTIDAGTTMFIGGGPLAGTNVTLSESSALEVDGWFSNSAIADTVAIDYPEIALGFGTATERAALRIGGDTFSLGNQTATLTDLAGISLGQATFTSTTLVRTVTNPSTIYIQGAPVAGANVTFTNGPYSIFVDAGASRFDGAIIGNQGTDIASASTIVIPRDGNTFELTGTTAVNLITTTGYQDGFKITLIANESVTINHGTATSGANVTILLSAAGNFAMTANDTLTLVLSTTTAGGQAWREVSRTVI